jgi:xylulokinase
LTTAKKDFIILLVVITLVRRDDMFAGIDIGTGSAKGAFLLNSEKVVSSTARYGGPSDRSGTQRTDVLAEAVEQLLRKAVNTAVEHGESIQGLAFSGHGPSLVLLDGLGRAEESLLTWQDSSAAAEAEDLSRILPDFSKTGECWEAKVLAAWKRLGGTWSGEKVLYPKDFVHYLLCGRAMMDHSSASTLAFFDPVAGVLEGEAAGIDSRIFPEIVKSWEMTGRCGTSFSRACGIKDGVPVYGGGIDAWCEAIGAGAVEPGMIVDGSGTSTCVSECLEEGASRLRHALPERCFRIETISYTGGSIRWAEELFGKTISEWKKLGNNSSPLPVIFLPYLIGERSPVWDKDASSLFMGLRNGDDGDTMMHAVLQGTAFAVGQCLDLLAPDRRGRSVRAVGGGAENLPWLKMKAGIADTTFQLMRDRDAAPLGAAMLAAYGAGEGDFRQLAERFTRVEAEVEPDKRHIERYRGLSAMYRRLYGTLKEEMKLLAEERRIE